MRTNILYGSVMASLLAMAGVASAQTYGTGAVPFVGYGGGYGGGYGVRHSSTYEEGVFRGLGDLTRSLGEADYMSSLGDINRQEALSRNIENRKKAVETYFQIKQINHAAREAARPQPLSPTQYAKLARQLAPERLSDVDYNRVVGRLNWPSVLTGDQFAAQREALDRAFAGRTARDIGVSTTFSSQVRQLTTQMQDTLRANLQSMSPIEFIAAQKFLASLSHEAQQSLVPTGLASAN